MLKRMTIKNLQNERAAMRYECEIQIGKEYEFPVMGKCVIGASSYRLEDNDGIYIPEGVGFPIGTGLDDDGNDYDVRFYNGGIIAYLIVHYYK